MAATAAFDRMVKERLYSKMRAKGLPAPVVEWSRAFLTDRRARARVDHATSRFYCFHEGCPQGTILGPLCWLVFIDDLQWGDRDSALLLAPSMGTQEAPPILWIGACRSDEAAASPFLSAIETDGDAVSVVNVPELDDEEARTLLELRLSGTARDEELLDELAGEAAGSPLLIDLLVRHAREHSPSGVDLGGALEAQMRDLDANARELLRVLAVRGKPILARTAAEVVVWMVEVVV